MSALSGSSRARAVRPRCSQRIGFSTDHTGPSTSERAASPTQSHTYTTYGTGLLASSRPRTSEARVQPVRARVSTTAVPRTTRESSTAAAQRGSGMPLVAAQPRLVPQRAEGDEGHDQGRGGPEHDRRERQRQVLAGADAVCRQQEGGQGWQGQGGERALRPPVSARRRTAASAAGGASRPGTRPASAPLSTIAIGVPALTFLLDLEAVGVQLVVVVTGDRQGQRLPGGQVHRGRCGRHLLAGDGDGQRPGGRGRGAGSRRRWPRSWRWWRRCRREHRRPDWWHHPAHPRWRTVTGCCRRPGR